MMQILFCDNVGIVRVIYLIKVLLNIVRFVLPISLIVMVTLDLYKNMISGTYDSKENVIKKSGNRIIACIVVFCIPTLINLIMALISKMGLETNSYSTSFATCYTEASIDLIKELEEKQELKLSSEEEAKRLENATLVANYEAKLKAQIEANQTSSGTSSGSYSSSLTDLNKQNKVYVENGVFYVPKFVDGNESTYSGKECPTGDALSQGYNNKYGYNNHFWTMMSNLIEASKKAGYNLSFQKEGCRSYTTQYNFYYEKYANQPGRAAKPGRSNHGWGIAADMIFYKNATDTCGSGRTRENCPGMAWAHDNASKYGLHFPLLNASYKEDWHMEPINLERY